MKRYTILCLLLLIWMAGAAGCGKTDQTEADSTPTGASTLAAETDDTQEAGMGESASESEGKEKGQQEGERQEEGQQEAEDGSESASGGEAGLEESQTEEGQKTFTPLHVEGTRLTDEFGTPVQLKGISTHGLAWYPEYVNEACFRQLKEEWGIDVVRLAMYTAESGGYCTDGNREELKALVRNGVEYATDCGLYVIIDWHILSDGNPNTHLDEAKKFFGEMSEEYAEYDNVLYEICNEPNGGTSWSEVKGYAEEIIPVIRANDGEGIILVGTPNWCQYVDQAAADPITGYDNIMYTLHFYAATHTDSLRKTMSEAVEDGLPVFVSEYGICDASGNGAIDTNQADRWVEAMDEYGISYVAWNLSNKSESSALLKSGCGKRNGFSDEDLSDSGRWLLSMLEQAGAAGETAGIGSAGGGDRAGGNGAAGRNVAGGNGAETRNGAGGNGAETGNGTGGNAIEAGTGNDKGGNAIGAGTGNDKGDNAIEAGTGNGKGGDANGAETGNGKGGAAIEAGTGTANGDKAEPGNGTSGNSLADGAAGGIEAGDLEVTAKVVNSWGQGSEACFQYELTLSNATDSPQKGWTVCLTFSSDITLQNGWNGNYKVDGNVLTISSMDYNAWIEKDGSVDGVGFIIQAAADCTLGN